MTPGPCYNRLYSSLAMIQLATAVFFVALGTCLTQGSAREPGVPGICRFLGGAEAAVSLQFDDSMTSQLANAIPLLNARGIHATFFVNTESGQYKSHRHEWEVDVPKAGHELGNHTAHHSGAKTIEELDKEIGLCSAQLDRVLGARPRLTSFAIPGGVPWGFTPEQLAKVLEKYRLVLADRRNFFDEQKTDPVSYVQKAIDTHAWSNVSMHGAGGEWLSTSLPTLTHLLDFMVAHRPALWIAPNIEIYKYVVEREAAEQPVVKRTGSSMVSVSVMCDRTKLETFGCSVAALYDQPLTVEISVPVNWDQIRIVQGKRVVHGEVVRAGLARIDVLPNAGSATVTQDSK